MALVLAACAGDVEPIEEAPLGAEAGGGSAEVRRGLFRVRGKLRELTYTVEEDGKAFLNGDIYLGLASELGRRPAATDGPRAIILAELGAIWPDGIVPYAIDPSVDAAGTADINASIADWTAQTPIQFVLIPGALPPPSRSLFFTAAEDANRCYSSPTGASTPTVVNLANGVCAGAARHEIGHALGLFHEHGRSDRDIYLSVHPEFAPGKEDQFEHETDGTDLYAFDWQSIMLYGSFTFMGSGDPPLTRRNAASYRADGTGTWSVYRSDDAQNALNLKYADFDNDGRDDAFRADGTQFWVSYTTSVGVIGSGAWTPLPVGGAYPPSQVLVGDFNGDGTADVFRADGTQWFISWSGTAPFITVKTSTIPASQLAVFDFDRDNDDDIFSATGAEWAWHRKFTFNGATTMLTTSLGPHPQTLSTIRLGHFNGDNVGDVFVHVPSFPAHLWRISYGGSAVPLTINTSAQPLSALRFGDFVGDTRTDVISSWAGSLRVTDAALGGWVVVASNNTPDPAYYTVAEITGNGKADLVANGLYEVFSAPVDAGSAYAVTRLHFGAFAFSAGGLTPWSEINISDVGVENLAFGIFRLNTAGVPDPITDVFYSDGATWWLSADGRSPWAYLNSSGYPIDQLRFGDFTGDGLTDVFRTDGATWWISSAGTGSWEFLNTSDYPLADLRFGSFDGDAKLDVFRADGTVWWFSSGGADPWQPLNTSAYTVADLRFADFDGNGDTDVFRADGTYWWASYDGAGPWEILNISGYLPGDLRFCDLNGNHADDVFRTDGTHWFVSYDGTFPWAEINTSTYTVDDVRFGTFDAGPTCDVFVHLGRLAQ